MINKLKGDKNILHQKRDKSSLVFKNIQRRKRYFIYNNFARIKKNWNYVDICYKISFY